MSSREAPNLGSEEYLFIVIFLWAIVVWSGSTSKGQIYLFAYYLY